MANSLRHLVEAKVNIQGASDHLVSDALYLADPEGNGIEIYRDRRREKWERNPGGGEVRMDALPLDVQGVMGELSGEPDSWISMPESTRIGHVHLHVADVSQAEDFYLRLLGFNLMARYGSSASFVSAGGYHHHIAFNTWAGVGASPPPPDATGLTWFDILFPDQEELNREVDRLKTSGVKIEETSQGVFIHDTAQNGIMMRIA